MKVFRDYPLDLKIVSRPNNPFENVIKAILLTRRRNFKEVEEYYNKMTDEDKRTLLLKVFFKKHLSVFEHDNYTFLIDKISRVAVQQLTRHRIASYTQESFRITEPTEFLIPLEDEEFINSDAVNNVIRHTVDFYAIWTAEDITSKDNARYILPMGALTSIMVSMNVREIVHFLSLRLCIKASNEIRLLANKLRTELINISPFFEDITGPSCYLEGRCYEPCREYKKWNKKYLKTVKELDFI